MNMPGFLDLKNSANIARWRWFWHLQGGSRHWAARSLRDLRNDEDLKRYRLIELKRRHTPHGRQVVNINAFRFERIRQRAFKRAQAL